MGPAPQPRALQGFRALHEPSLADSAARRMSLTLTVDGERWRQHLRQVADDNPGLTPSTMGNGYGFGLGRLARKADWLGVDTLAVGTYDELPEVAQRFSGDLMVLTPWRPTGQGPAQDLPLGRG